jgi:hypothetical protein
MRKQMVAATLVTLALTTGTAYGLNPIEAENQKPGSTGWQLPFTPTVGVEGHSPDVITEAEWIAYAQQHGLPWAEIGDPIAVFATASTVNGLDIIRTPLNLGDTSRVRCESVAIAVANNSGAKPGSSLWQTIYGLAYAKCINRQPLPDYRRPQNIFTTLNILWTL